MSRSHYVYRLIDPLGGDTFYVGKGTNLRAWRHEQEAAVDTGSNSRKRARIKTILACGRAPAIEIHGRYRSDCEASAAEKRLAEDVGYENLTNVAPAGQPATSLKQTRGPPRRVWVPYLKMFLRHAFNDATAQRIAPHRHAFMSRLRAYILEMTRDVPLPVLADEAVSLIIEISGWTNVDRKYLCHRTAFLLGWQIRQPRLEYRPREQRLAA